MTTLTGHGGVDEIGGNRLLLSHKTSPPALPSLEESVNVFLSAPGYVPVAASPPRRRIHLAPFRDWSTLSRFTIKASPPGHAARHLAASTDLLRSYRVHDDVFKERFPAQDCSKPYQPPNANGLDQFA